MKKLKEYNFWANLYWLLRKSITFFIEKLNKVETKGILSENMIEWKETYKKLFDKFIDFLNLFEVGVIGDEEKLLASFIHLDLHKKKFYEMMQLF